MQVSGSASPFLWIGNQRALDFVNTELMQQGERTDLLDGLGALLRWLVEAELLPEGAAPQLLARWSGSPEASALMASVRELRAAMRALTQQRMEGRALKQQALDVINASLALDAGHDRLVRTSTGCKRRRERRLATLPPLLRPIAEAAAELLCETDPRLIKRCGNHACILFFYDVSKNHTRRWCSMEVCGNRTKVAAHYQRQRRGRDA